MEIFIVPFQPKNLCFFKKYVPGLWTFYHLCDKILRRRQSKMAFAIKDEEKAENNKQHLNLSLSAYEVVSNDMFTFGEDKLSGFINTVFEHYYPKAEASISRTLSCLRDDISKLLSDIPEDGKTKKRIVDRLIKQREKDLAEKAASYERGKPFKFWINKRNLEYLTEANSECGEEVFYPTRGRYIKSVLEEYSRLPYIEREKVYFTPFVEAISYAIEKERQLRAVTDTDKIYSVYPCEMRSDPLSIANYLMGYCKRYGFSEDEKKPCSFRISALKSVKVEKSKSAFLKECERKRLAQNIAARGVQFTVGVEAEIHVRLTEDGVHKYRRQTHLRPAFIEKREGNTLVLRCTPAQAEFYFFKFGKDAEILRPASLRDKFASMYENAANTYAENGKEI
jgi:hypothetical protein